MEGHDVRVYVLESTGLNGMSENCETSHSVSLLHKRFATSVSLPVISKKLNPSAMKEYDIRGEYVYNA